MAAVVRIVTSSAEEAGDLADVLARRGLTALSIPGGEGVELEVGYRCEQQERLLRDVKAAVEGWLVDRGRDAIAVRAGGRTHLVRPHPELYARPMAGGPAASTARLEPQVV